MSTASLIAGRALAAALLLATAQAQTAQTQAQTAQTQAQTAQTLAKVQAQTGQTGHTATYAQVAFPAVSWTRAEKLTHGSFRLVVDEAKFGASPADKLKADLVEVKRDGVSLWTPESPAKPESAPKVKLTSLQPGVISLDLTLVDLPTRGGDIEASVRLAPVPEANAAALPPQVLKLTLKPVRAHLTVPKTTDGVGLRLERTLWMWGADVGLDPATPAPLHVNETTGNEATGVKVQQDNVSVAGATTAHSGVLEFYVPNVSPPAAGQPTLHTVPGGGELLLTSRLKGDFALGETKGRVVVQGENLDQETEFAYTLKVKVSPVWIFVLGALGVGMGWLVRTLLPAQVAVSNARVRGLVLLQQLRGQTAYSADATYATRLQGLITALQAELEKPGLTAKDLDAHLATAETQHKAALDRLDAAVTTQIEGLEPWQKQVNTDWSLPEPLQPLRNQVLAVLHTVEERLMRRDPKAAAALLEGLKKSDFRTLVQQSAQWRLDLSELLPALANAPVPAAEEDLKALKDLHTKAAAPDAITTAKERVIITELTEAAQIGTELKVTNELNHWLRKVAASLPADVERFCDLQANAVKKLPSSPTLTPEMIQASAQGLTQAGRTFAASLRPLLKAALPGVEARRLLETEVRRLQEAWQAALLPLAAEAPAKQTALQTAVTNRQWTAAMKAVDVQSGAGPLPQAGLELMHAGAIPAPEAAAPDGLKVVLPQWTPLNIAAMIAENEKKARSKERLQNGIVLVLFATFATLFLADEWVGTAPEVARLLLAAFLTDLSIDKLKPLAGQKGLPF